MFDRVLAEGPGFADPKAQIWLDGALTPWAEAGAHVMSKGLQYALAVFEGVRSYDGALGPAVFRLRDHCLRLGQSAALMGLEPPLSTAELMAAHLAVLKANRLLSAYIRPVLFLSGDQPGVGSVGERTRLAIVAWHWPAPTEWRGGARLMLSDYRRAFAHERLSQAKASANYAVSHLAVAQARKAGFDDAVLLDERGLVSEATTSNIFLVSQGAVVTPALGSALPGITRATVMTLAASLGLDCQARPVSAEDIAGADEVFLTGTGCEVRSVAAVGDRVFSPETPVTDRLRGAYLDAVHGRDGRVAEWLTPYDVTDAPARQTAEAG